MTDDATPAKVRPNDGLGVCRPERAAGGLRGFGVTITPGGARNWYAGADGVRRWVSNDQPCDPPPRGCHECAWGKVLGCWRCGGR